MPPFGQVEYRRKNTKHSRGSLITELCSNDHVDDDDRFISIHSTDFSDRSALFAGKKLDFFFVSPELSRAPDRSFAHHFVLRVCT